MCIRDRESTKLRSFRNPESGDVLLFFYTIDITEQKLQEQLLKRIAKLDYDSITEVDVLQGTHRPVSKMCIRDRNRSYIFPSNSVHVCIRLFYHRSFIYAIYTKRDSYAKRNGKKGLNTKKEPDT